jgi:divalent metal cation (Fe/Co/Zn/Cd) transporter
VIVKIFLGTFVKRQGLKVVSQSLVASGRDALYDAVISVSVLISAVIFLTSGICLEAYVALFISLYIVKAGIEMMLETLNHLLGARADSKKTAQIKQILTSDPNVRGAYDLILYNFGPDKDYASVHLELPDIMKVKDVDCLTRKLETEVYRQTGVVLAGVGVYSYNTENSEIAVIQNDVRKKVIAHDWAIQFHGFYVDLAAKEMRFDVVMSFDIDHQDGLKIIYDEISSAYPDFHIEISPDVDISVSD